MAIGTINHSHIDASEFPLIEFNDFTPDNINLFGITFHVSNTVYYRLCIGMAADTKQLFLEKNNNGTVTRIWTATVT